MATLTNCKTCGKEVAKSAKKCPHCGETLRTGAFTKLVAIVLGLIIAFVVVAVMFAPTTEEKAVKAASVADQISNAPVAKVEPHGELASMFMLLSPNTDVQRQNKINELKGKVVDWKLHVFEVKRDGDRYRVQTAGDNEVGTIAIVSPRSDQEKQAIEKLVTGDLVAIRGMVDGVQMRHIVLKPAFLSDVGKSQVLQPTKVSPDVQQTTEQTGKATASVQTKVDECVAAIVA